jgi:RimJ/RimL family protein N-acetyltransferase
VPRSSRVQSAGHAPIADHGEGGRANDVSLREAEEDDLELLMAWRSNPMVYQHFTIQNQPLTWEEHLRWWLTRKHRRDWMVLLNDGGRVRSVGSANASRLNEQVPEVGLYIGESTLWGKGVGRDALTQVLIRLARDGYSHCWAGIQAGNDRSRRLFERLGFRLVGPSTGRLRYERDITTFSGTPGS